MALSAESSLIKCSQSDYGSDFDTDDETILTGLLSELEADAPKPLVLESIEDEPVTSPAPTRNPLVQKGRKRTSPQQYGEDVLEEDLRRRKLRSPSVEVEYAEHSRMSWNGKTCLFLHHFLYPRL
jgi:exonuclease V